VAFTLLIVEDDEDISALLCEIFEERGHDVTCANNGQRALDAVRDLALRPDVIVLDLLMPVMAGDEFLVARREEPLLTGVPVVLLTAQPTAVAEIDADVFARLTKPASIDEIVATVELACSQAQPNR
jgi:DNA-binding response OmpR family regulator